MFRSLRSRLGALFLGFLILVAASVAVTFLAIDAQTDDARVINLAGRQRMLTQQMVWLALARPDQPELAAAIDHFDRTLTALRDGGVTLDADDRSIVLPPAPDQAIHTQLDDIAQTWADFRSQLRPHLQPPDAAGLQALSPVILAQIDQLVGDYETRAQAKITQLQIIQTAFFAIALALVAAGYFITRRQIIQPLSALESATRRMAIGQLTEPLPPLCDDELGEVGRAFETMRREIVAAQDQLEARVNQRTRELTAAFELSQEIVGQIDLDRLLQSVTDRARTLMQATAASLCLIDRDPQLLALVANSGSTSAPIDLRQSVERDPAQQVVVNGETVVVEADRTACAFLGAHAPGKCAVAPLRAGQTMLGALCVVRARTRDQHQPFDANETRALTLLANSAAIAITNARLAEERRRQTEQAAISSERERLAAELHDNLAQTLSFLNLKSDRVRELIGAQDSGHATTELERMKSAIGTAYDQVRMALTGLHEPLPTRDDFAAKLSACVAEFGDTTGLRAELIVADSTALMMPPVVQTQALHIVRESLVNIRRHAQAQQVQVQVGRVNGSARFVIADDGRGFDLNNVDGGQHLGLGIMRTRAERCGGSLDVVSTPGRGTTISATLPLVE
ncbi:MAG: type IV pili methyl-accepting chemotaxis transducer N-terminal domain-containing protein [Chloroflexi bacterium]|nr:type IV pili methyl-accepting chemotaxis transducer N-terminal domain-containing protein [Chloroflexota bacterium]